MTACFVVVIFVMLLPPAVANKLFLTSLCQVRLLTRSSCCVLGCRQKCRIQYCLIR